MGSKWVFRIKKDAEGGIVKFKARLVAQGFSQVPGIDYFDTYAPVARLASIRSILAMAAALDLELHQVDIKGAYLNGKLTDKEIIYMRQPPGYPEPGSHPGQVCRLVKTLYGLKQSGRRWYQRLVEILVEKLGFKQCDVDQAVFYKQEGRNLTVIAVHVDDCTIAASSLRLVREVKEGMAKYVEVTDLGELHWILGIEITRDRESRSHFSLATLVHRCHYSSLWLRGSQASLHTNGHQYPLVFFSCTSLYQRDCGHERHPLQGVCWVH